MAAILGTGGMGRVAAADAPAPGEVPALARPRTREIVIEVPVERSRTNVIALASVAGAAVLAGAIGLSYHLDARSATEEIEGGAFQGRPWTQAQIDLVERAERSSAAATVCYGIGGALILGAAVAYIVTAPRSRTSVIRTIGAAPTVAPVAGGAVLGGAWRF